MTIAQAALDVLRETDSPAVVWGDCTLLDTIGERVGMPSMHPLRRHKRILDALDRSPRFVKSYVRYGRLVRRFDPAGSTHAHRAP